MSDSVVGLNVVWCSRLKADDFQNVWRVTLRISKKYLASGHPFYIIPFHTPDSL